MKKWKRCLKLNNRGSSMALALVAIIFVTLLASTVMAVSVANLSLKRVETNSKTAFYTAETAVDELYNALGKQALDSMNDSYVEQLSDLIKTDATDKTAASLMSDDDANKAMKFKFIKNVLYAITTDPEPTAGEVPESPVTLDSTGVYVSTANKQSVVHWLNSKLPKDKSGNSLIRVSSVGVVRAYASNDATTGYYVEISDVVINYKSGTSKSGTAYYADITTDFRVTYPDIKISFNNNKNTDFLNYCLIADKNISFGNARGIDSSDTTNAGTRVVAEVKAGMYAGSEININHGSQVELNVSGASQVMVVAHGGINIVSAEQGAGLTIGNAKVWSEQSVTLMGESDSTTAGANLTTDANTELYVGDDLELNQENSKATIKGKYYGYQFSEEASENNSSIIMNKNNCTIDMSSSDLSALWLLGHAYINIGANGGYETGESVSVKNTQEIYMVLDTYLNGIANPVSATNLQKKLTEVEFTKEEVEKFDPDDSKELKFTVTVTTEGKEQTEAEKLMEKFNNGNSDLTAREKAAIAKIIDIKSLTKNFFAATLLETDQPYTFVYDDSKKAYYIYYNFASSGEGDSASINREEYVTKLLNEKLSDDSFQQERNVLIKNIKKTFNKSSADTATSSPSITMPNTNDDKKDIKVLGAYARSLSLATAEALEAGDTVDVDAGNLTVPEARSKSINTYNTLLADYGQLASDKVFSNIINITTVNKYLNGESEGTYKNGSTETEKDTSSDSGEEETSDVLGDQSIYPYKKDGKIQYYQLCVINDNNTSLNLLTNRELREKYKTTDGELEKWDDDEKVYGIVIHTGEGVLTVDDDFTGLIISAGTINIRSGSVFASDKNTLTKILENRSYFAKFFKAYYTEPDDDVSSISSLDYDDLVSLRNWRKFDDTDTSETTSGATS